MKLNDKIYVSDGIKLKKIVLRRFKKNKIIPGIYLICLAKYPDQLEIIKADYFKQDFLRNDDYEVVAFASGYDDATNIVIEMTKRAIAEFGEPDIRRLFV